MSEILTDQSIMPYGMHKGKKMIDVPDSYLQYHYDQQLAGKMNRYDAKRVEQYCIENAAALGITIFKRG